MDRYYRPPLQDMLFLLDEVLHWQQLFALPEFQHADSDLGRAVLSEGAKLCAEVLAPANPVADREGSRLCAGGVVTPEVFKTVNRAFVDGGWPGLDLPEEFGGQGLPWTVQVAFAEMVNGACVAFGMLPIAARAAAWLLLEHADATLQARVLPQLTTGRWAATIGITEAQAGSDVGRIRTRARVAPDGSYRLTGSKIFISYADHDLTEQIVHMILARTEDAPAGSRGLSLFLVPKRHLDNAEPNGVTVTRVEPKMGLKASPTCALELENATGYRIGGEHQGLRSMFTMMNIMRLEVAVQGVAVAGAATRKALQYAAQRPQGGVADKPAVMIIEHADVRRMLLLMRARTEALRALVYETAMQMDLARAAENDIDRQQAGRLAGFLLPICKICGSEAGFDVASLALQVMGGYGYTADAGIEQYVRDARVMSIYEGSNGIQALDLVTRKLIKDTGVRYQLFTGRIKQDLELYSRLQQSSVYKTLVAGLTTLEDATGIIVDSARTGSFKMHAIAVDYVQLLGLVACAWMWLRMSAAAEGNSLLHQEKRAVADFYANWVMPELVTRNQRINTDTRIIESVTPELLATGD